MNNVISGRQKANPFKKLTPSIIFATLLLPVGIVMADAPLLPIRITVDSQALNVPSDVVLKNLKDYLISLKLSVIENSDRLPKEYTELNIYIRSDDGGNVEGKIQIHDNAQRGFMESQWGVAAPNDMMDVQKELRKEAEGVLYRYHEARRQSKVFELMAYPTRGMVFPAEYSGGKKVSFQIEIDPAITLIQKEIVEHEIRRLLAQAEIEVRHGALMKGDSLLLVTFESVPPSKYIDVTAKWLRKESNEGDLMPYLMAHEKFIDFGKNQQAMIAIMLSPASNLITQYKANREMEKEAIRVSMTVKTRGRSGRSVTNSSF